MNWFGYITSARARQFQPAPAFLPDFNWYECHDSRPIRAEPHDIIAAAKSPEMQRDWIIDGLMRLRNTPSAILNRFRTDPAAKTVQFSASDAFQQLSESNDRLELGLTGKFWQMELAPVSLASPQEFMQFDDPDCGKLVVRYMVIERPGKGHILRTETFVQVIGAKARRKFAVYWLLIRLPSGLIRRRMLKRIERQFNTVTAAQ